jgi:uncharacterized protein (DUF305 family)
MSSALTRVVAVLTCLAAAAMFVSACSKAPPDADTGPKRDQQPMITGEPPGHNAADIAFATNMIPHHQQAVDMSALVADRSSNAEVQKLASDISSAQGAEVQTFKVLLVQWEENPDLTTGGGNGGQGGGMHGMQGMVDDATMARLTSLQGDEFDQLWLQSMIGHHQGAIAMAKAETADGANVDAKSIAQNIVTTQQAQIDQMSQLLGG